MDGTKFDGLKWTRKPADWNDVRADDRALGRAVGLPVFQASGSPMDYFQSGRPQFFVAQRPNGELFLVNTEGADYCRYVVRIVGLPSELAKITGE